MPAKKITNSSSAKGEVKKAKSSKKSPAASPKSMTSASRSASKRLPSSSGVVRAAPAKKRKQIEFDMGGASVSSKKKRGPPSAEEDVEHEEGDEAMESTPKRVSAKKRFQQAQRAAAKGSDSEDEDEVGLVEDDGEEDLSDVADAESLSSDEDDNPFVRARREGTKLSYPVLRLRFLPAEFEEPQLFKFLNQFGANVLNCFCVRSKRTFQSLGIAYVQFDNPKVLPIVREECDGMLLGARTVRARVISLHRAMPSKEAVTRRRLLGRSYRDQGRPMKQFLNPSRKNDVAMLIKATRSEVRNNHQLQKLGIAFSSHAFSEQLAALPKSAILPKKQSMVEALLALARQQTANADRQSKKGSAEGSTEITHKLLHQALGRPTGRQRPGKGDAKKATRRGKSSTAGAATPQAKKAKSPQIKKKVRRSLRKKKSGSAATKAVEEIVSPKKTKAEPKKKTAAKNTTIKK